MDFANIQFQNVNVFKHRSIVTPVCLRCLSTSWVNTISSHVYDHEACLKAFLGGKNLFDFNVQLPISVY